MNKNKPKIEDNFLDEAYFKHLSGIMCGDTFNWCANEYSDYKDDPNDNNIQFTHMFMFQGFIAPSFNLVGDLMKQINPMAIHRVKANLLVRTKRHEKQNMHIDIQDSTNFKSGIFYLYTNNGYTLFEDGTKVKCVANRLLTFDGPTRHCAVTQTDTPFRIIINMNWVDY